MPKTRISVIIRASEINHKLYGKGIVKSTDEKYIVITFPEQEKN